MVTWHKGTTNFFGIHKLTSCYHAGFQELNSAVMISGKNINETCCHNRSADPKPCGEANCGKRLHKLRFFSAEHDIRHGAMPEKHLVLDAKPAVCLSSGRGQLLRASC